MQIAWVQGLSNEGTKGAKKRNLNLVRSHAAKVARSRQTKASKESCSVHDYFIEECLECWRINQRKQARTRAVLPLLPKSEQTIASSGPVQSRSASDKSSPRDIFSQTPRWLQIYASIAAFQFDPLYEILNIRRILTRDVLVVIHYEACFHALTALMLDVHSKTTNPAQTLSQEPLTHVGKAMSLLRRDLAQPRPQNRAAIMTTVYALAAFEFQRYGHTDAHRAHKDVLTALCKPWERGEDDDPILVWIKTVIEQNGFSWSVKPGYSVLGEPVPYPALSYPSLPLPEALVKTISTLPLGFQTLIQQGKISNQCIIILQRVHKRNEQMKDGKRPQTLRISDFTDTDEEGRPPSTHFWQACPALLLKDDDFDIVDEPPSLFSATRDARILRAAALEKIISLTLMLFALYTLNSIPAMHTSMCTVMRSRLTVALSKAASLSPKNSLWTEPDLTNELRAQEECLFWAWQYTLQLWGVSGNVLVNETTCNKASVEGGNLTRNLTKRFEWIYAHNKSQETLEKFFWKTQMRPINFKP